MRSLPLLAHSNELTIPTHSRSQRMGFRPAALHRLRQGHPRKAHRLCRSARLPLPPLAFPRPPGTRLVRVPARRRSPTTCRATASSVATRPHGPAPAQAADTDPSSSSRPTLQEECIPAEKLFHDQISTDPATRWKSYPHVIEELKQKAKDRGLWMLWANKAQYAQIGNGLSNLEYAVMAEIMGHAIRVAPEATNSSAPDTGEPKTFWRRSVRPVLTPILSLSPRFLLGALHPSRPPSLRCPGNMGASSVPTSPSSPNQLTHPFPSTPYTEVLARYGNDEQKRQWLQPLIEGKIRSSFAMTEYGIASSE